MTKNLILLIVLICIGCIAVILGCIYFFLARRFSKKQESLQNVIDTLRPRFSSELPTESSMYRSEPTHIVATASRTVA